MTGQQEWELATDQAAYSRGVLEGRKAGLQDALKFVTDYGVRRRIEIELARIGQEGGSHG